MSDDGSAPNTEPAFVDRYPSPQAPAHRWRTRGANGRAALALIAGIVLVIIVLAIAA